LLISLSISIKVENTSTDYTNVKSGISHKTIETPQYSSCDCGDSALSTTANILSILTFTYILVAGSLYQFALHQRTQCIRSWSEMRLQAEIEQAQAAATKWHVVWRWVEERQNKLRLQDRLQDFQEMLGTLEKMYVVSPS
jgi:hypothetical protein